MVYIYPSRKKSVLANKKQADSLVHRFLPPVAGWISNPLLANQNKQSAFVLENFWPTVGSIEPRGGSEHRATIQKSVTSLFAYQPSKTYFAADKNNIYQFSELTREGEVLQPILTGQTSGNYSHVEMKTEGGTYLIAVNGADKALIYDGENWQKLTNDSRPFSITNVDSENLEHCWTYRNRIFFTQRGKLDAWYLHVNSVAGEAHRLPLGGIFTKGGALLFGARASSDSGDGLDDRCVFVTDKGELAIFEGGNPSDASDWKLIGVYDIGEPLGRHAVINVGGDILLATKIGLLPLSAAVQKDPTQLKLHVASRAIDSQWRFETILSGGHKNWQIAKWDSRNMAIVAPPPNSKVESGYCWVVNLETGAWSKFTGWRISSVNVFGDAMFFGDTAGKIFAADIGGEDAGRSFECRACLAFENLGSPAQLKAAHMLRAIWRYRVANGRPIYSVAKDYEVKFLPTPSAMAGSVAAGESRWEHTSWDSSEWGTSFAKDKIYKTTKTVAVQGTTLAPQIQLVSSQATKLDCELVSLELFYSLGGVV